MLVDFATAHANGDGQAAFIPSTDVLLTRDGEFHTDKDGFLVHASGYYLVSAGVNGAINMVANNMRKVFNNIDNPGGTGVGGNGVRLTDFLTNKYPGALDATNSVFTSLPPVATASFVTVQKGLQELTFSRFGSTVFAIGAVDQSGGTFGQITYSPNLKLEIGLDSDATVLDKSLEASNASMTQTVPELSLAQKLFSALTKVVQIHQTNTDAVINLIR